MRTLTGNLARTYTCILMTYFKDNRLHCCRCCLAELHLQLSQQDLCLILITLQLFFTEPTNMLDMRAILWLENYLLVSIFTVNVPTV